jgi:AcrR family transcriptional regulator
MAEIPTTRRRRANGEESRRKILDAAADVASERGYDGTSIALVSKKCGLPASSIYWHFKDKDDLIAAVIERSFGTWLEAVSVPDGDNPRTRIADMSMQIARALLETPDFLRLGLMLALERRPEEVRARTMFLSVRDEAHRRIAATMREFAPDLSEKSIKLLTTYAISAADGLFIAKEIGGDDVDLIALFELHGNLVYDAAVSLAQVAADR